MNDAIYGPLWLSLRVSAAATLLVIAAGAPLSFWTARTRMRARGLITGLLISPIVLPPTVLGIALLSILGRRGPLGIVLERLFGATVVFHWTGAAIAAACAAFPMFFLPAKGAFEGIDPALEDAARLLGRGERSVFFDVTLPLARRGLAAGAALAFLRALGDFGTTLMVAGDIPGRTRTAPLAIYAAWERRDLATATWLACATSALAIAVLLVVERTTSTLLGSRR